MEGMNEGAVLKGIWMCEKYNVQVDRNVPGELEEFWREVKSGRVSPMEILKKANVLLNSGINEMWDILKGAVSTNHFFNATDTKIGVGTTSTAAVATQTDLLGGAVYVGMDSGWPKTKTDDGALGAGVFQTKATFGTGDANQAWNEAVVKNTNGASNKCLCRAATGWGTKTSAATWVATHTITLS